MKAASPKVIDHANTDNEVRTANLCKRFAGNFALGFPIGEGSRGRCFHSVNYRRRRWRYRPGKPGRYLAPVVRGLSCATKAATNAKCATATSACGVAVWLWKATSGGAAIVIDISVNASDLGICSLFCLVYRRNAPTVTSVVPNQNGLVIRTACLGHSSFPQSRSST